MFLGVCPGTYFRGASECLSSSWPACVPMRRLVFPGEELHVSGAIPVRTVISVFSAVPALLATFAYLRHHPRLPPSFLPLPVIPASPRHSCSSLRHSCEGRNLNQGMDVLICTSP
jgi:hypothetical protein